MAELLRCKIFALNGGTSNWVAPGGVVSNVLCNPVAGEYISLSTGDWSAASTQQHMTEPHG